MVVVVVFNSKTGICLTSGSVKPEKGHIVKASEGKQQNLMLKVSSLVEQVMFFSGRNQIFYLVDEK